MGGKSIRKEEEGGEKRWMKERGGIGEGRDQARSQAWAYPGSARVAQEIARVARRSRLTKMEEMLGALLWTGPLAPMMMGTARVDSKSWLRAWKGPESLRVKTQLRPE
jgi:hypothetical protein